ncbi:PAS domain-containing protein [Dermatophilus congolensis]|uniref:PAS domain-containing protein n=1 Tax=Dermatophilus congolensis TaxID=1863 RepID=UPI001AB0210B|nr:PAS domain-containing protein [Dermatophilus congolensis]MBO3178170.1 PAS domain-containing protein [Dermatophilus congolensis]MBO3186673.1 PAS domain-containing protein [Dermatophilus congolensis]
MAHHEAPQPTNVETIVGESDYFFSTTDRKGIIELANAVFVRLSQYEHDQLQGSPHNIVRHPDMPAGVFKSIWGQLKAGRPACAYMKNMAADGSTYWLISTLIPVGETFLSVRMGTLVHESKKAAEKLYADIRAAEREARENGASADEAATMGLELMTAELSKTGIRSPEDLAYRILPAEVAAHEQVGRIPQRPEATGYAAEMLHLMHEIDDMTAGSVAQLDEYASLISVLEASAADAGPASDRLTIIADAAQNGANIEDVPEMIATFTTRLTEKVESAIDKLAGLDEALTALATDVARLRFRIALLRLHNRMIGSFCVEVIDSQESFDALPSLRILTQALGEEADELAAAITQVRGALAAVPDQVQDAVRDADRTLRLSTKWRGEAVEAEGDVAAALAPALAALTENSASGFAELGRFYDVAARCFHLPDRHDDAGLAALIGRIHSIIDNFNESEAA